ncbi:MAG: YlxR family protein [Actinomycetota bacterium]
MKARRPSEPARTCIGCRQVRPKSELVRIVRSTDGSAVVDREARAPGRGAYVHPTPECVARAGRRLAGALRSKNVDFSRLGRELLVG